MNRREMIAEITGEKGAFHSFVYFTSVTIERTPHTTHIRFKNNGATVAAFMLYPQEYFPTINAMLWPHIDKRTCRGCVYLYDGKYCGNHPSGKERIEVDLNNRPMFCR